jgi:glutamate racemase
MIGFFDSGFGGLSVLSEWQRKAPEYSILFLGDSVRAPYGSRSSETVIRYTDEGVSWLFENGAKIVVVACNSASSEALQYVQKKYPGRKVLGILIPTAEEALQKTRFGRIGVVGTRRTVESQNYEKAIKKLVPKYYSPQENRSEKIPKIVSVSAPLLVPLIEEGWQKRPETRSILKKYLLSLKGHNIDTLVLGCSHYSLLKKEFQRKMGKQCLIIDSSAVQAKKLREYLTCHPETERTLDKEGKHMFFTTGCPEKFRILGSTFLGRSLGKNFVKKVDYS